MIRRFAAAALFLLLASCKPGTYRAHADFLGGRLAFVHPEGRALNGCWQELKVVGERGVAWRFTHPGVGECANVFPLFYGRVPEGAAETVPAARLEPGRLYVLDGDLTLTLEGAFVLDRAQGRLSVRNVDPRSPEAQRLRRLHAGPAGGS
jgi:hypothetical protein